jgi:hypothetical protein
VAERLVLHIGAMKTGTTFLQSALAANRAVHEEAGFRFVADFGTQAQAVRRVLAAPGDPSRPSGWRALVEEARRYEGEAAVVSMEFLSFAKRHQIDAYLRSAEGLDVQVVMTVRDQQTAIPAQWQSYTRLFGTDSWASYLSRIDPARQGPGDEDSRACRTYRRAQQLVPILQRWSAHPAVSRTDIVVVPPSSAPRDRLWQLFAGAVGMPADLAVLTDDLFSNTSLGFASSEVLRCVNAHLQGHRMAVYRRGLRPLIRDALAPRRAEEGRPAVDRAGGAFARRGNEDLREHVLRAGHRVHGSLDDLTVSAPERDLPRRAPAPPRRQVREAAAALWDRCAEELGLAGSRRPRRLEDQIADIGRMVPLTPAWQRASRARGSGTP